MTGAAPTRLGPRRALAQRLAAAAEVLCPHLSQPTQRDAGTLLEQLIRVVQRDRDDAAVWLLLTALMGAYPTLDLHLACRRHLELNAASECGAWLLEATAGRATVHGSPAVGMVVVTDRVVADVDFTARMRLHTGIQRVVREVMPALVRDHDVLPVAWQPRGGCFRELSESELEYLVDWPGVHGPTPEPPDVRMLVVPWRTKVLIPEVPSASQNDALVALARFSGNDLVLIGYDCIPAVSAELVPALEREKFGRYLELVKYSDRVVGISQAASAEFAGFVAALGTQGITGPTVTACPLPNVTKTPQDLRPLDFSGPVVLGVGSLDVRKNQIATVLAAEQLWQAGERFTLLLVGGGGGRPKELMSLIRQLEGAGRSIVVATDAPEDYLHRAYATARFTVFPSLHEGYGLPIVESLSHGTPVITSNFGSTRECAEGQGSLLVEPESVDEIAAAMRSLLVDDELLARLAKQAAARTERTWEDYVRDLWQLVQATGRPDPEAAA